MTETDERRRDALGLMARAPKGRVAALLDPIRPDAAPTWLRPAEVGSVMVRGRTGGTGSAFNLGEVTVTRASVRLPSGTVGHGYVQGRSKTCAEAFALADALALEDADAVEAAVLAPLRAEEDARRATRAAKAAATKVEFFTMVRGEK